MTDSSENSLKFAVVREDPFLEIELVQRLAAKHVLLVASGGCTALSLARRFPTLNITAFDINPKQLAQLNDKLLAVRAGDLGVLNVDNNSPNGINQRGEFERFFRVMQNFFLEFVSSQEELKQFFEGNQSPLENEKMLKRWFTSKYWRAMFESMFSEPILVAMFGTNAMQHAIPGSYPRYFQLAFERGLRRPDAHRNPFLQHILLGCYLRRDAPPYTDGGSLTAPEFILGTLDDISDLSRFDLFSLSNLFDWSSDARISQWANILKVSARPGIALLIRQLNNELDVRRFFEPEFAFDEALGARFLEQDRSLFYNHIWVGFRA